MIFALSEISEAGESILIEQILHNETFPYFSGKMLFFTHTLHTSIIISLVVIFFI